ncbi:hypothetical protein [Streptomyces atratus]|uniref:Uncharacterized protein n=1 Tax=Streptomyces atratus TaxID=1893 RepID=A0A2Z5JPF8_STRAR|nr:hypothetical protein [Streptomyces atratus]AXE82253.1 hypothetical protein C5746_41455 [Streptomyces atratus]
MSDQHGSGLWWIGEHAYQDAKGRVPGMLRGISLTAARGVDTEEFLVRLGADPEQLECGELYKERHELAIPPDMGDVSRAMYGTCGGWLYVLEDTWAATWSLGYREVPEMDPFVGEEIICLTLNLGPGPSRILHAPGDDGRTWQAEFAESTGRNSKLDTALHAAGAVFPTAYDGVHTQEEASRYFEEHHRDIPARVFASVGDYCGLTIDRAAVEAGTLPLVLLPVPQL